MLRVCLFGRLGFTKRAVCHAKKNHSACSFGSSFLKRMQIRKPAIGRTFLNFGSNQGTKLVSSIRNYVTERPIAGYVRSLKGMDLIRKFSDSAGSLREILAETLQGVTSYQYTTGPELRLPYDSDSQIRNVFRITNAFVNSIGTRDKKRERAVIVTGISGAGKTRFLMELPGLILQACEYPEQIRSALTGDIVQAPSSFQQYAQKRPEQSAPSNSSKHEVPNPDAKSFEDKVQSLKAALSKNCKKIYIEWRHNDRVYLDSIERHWPSSVKLGLRVAAQYWFPNINFSIIRERMRTSPYLEKFTLLEVLNAMYREDESISAVYIALDEFHTTTQVQVPSERTNIGSATELLSCSLARALVSAARMHGKCFVFGAIAGTALLAEDIIADTTDDTFIRAPVQLLSYHNVQNIIRRSDFDGTSGGEWLALKGFDALIKIVAGLPRAVELLVELIKEYQILPANIDVCQWSAWFLARYEQKFNVAAVLSENSSRVWALLLGVAGYNVASLNVITGTLDAPSTVASLEKVGFFSTVDKPVGSDWEKCYNACRRLRSITVLDVPLPLLLIMVRKMIQIRSPDPARTFSETEAIELRNQLADLAYYINLSWDEKLPLIHLLFRWNIFNFADNNEHISAADLFVGGLFSPEFGARQFVKEPTVIGLNRNPVQGVCATMSKKKGRFSADGVQKVTDSVELAHRSVLKFSDMSPQTRGVVFGGTDLFDSHIRLWIKEGRKKRRAIIWIDEKHTVPGSREVTLREVRKIIKKRKFLEEKLPQYVHLAVIYSNRAYNGGVPPDPNTCVIAKDGMSFSMSPLMNRWLLGENI